MLSLSMIVRDGAAQLDRCLASVADVVDEMVVVDTGSRDESVAIARRWGAVVHHLPWPGDFAPARNRALDWVTGDWVLVLDADEWLLPAARQPLLELIQQPDALLITMLRREIGATQSPYSSVSRLFRRHPDIRWSRRYHAMVDDSVMDLLRRESRWRILHCSEPALGHDGYRPEALASGDKAARLRQAMESERRERPGDPYACAKLGALEVSEGNAARGIRLLEEGLAHCPPDAAAERFELLLHLAIARSEDAPERATEHYREALELPLDPRVTLAAHLNLTALLLRGGDRDGALVHAGRGIGIAPDVALAWYNVGLVQRQRGELGEAISAYRRAIELDPDHAEAHQNLAVALLLGGDIRGSRQGFQTAIQLLDRQGRSEAAAALRQRAGTLVKLEA
jgi:tetratricopeptide (TPR) repeat protein